MKHLFLTILFLCAVSVNVSAQYDPCKELRIALLSVDRLVVEGKLDSALVKLNKFKNDSEMKDCPEMKDDVVDYKIQEIQRKISEQNSKLPSFIACPNNNHPHAIDLGLPSGTKWACCNVGASKPEDYGGYYAWGETEEKNKYSRKNYKYKKKTIVLGSIISGAQFDVANLKWGSSWQIPCYGQLKELLDNSKHEWVTLNGVNGCRFIGYNGANIFLPAAGCYKDSSLDRIGDHGVYWLNSLHPMDEKRAHGLQIGSGYADSYGGYRFLGQSIRPVTK